MIIDAAYFIDNIEIRNVLLRGSEIRVLALDILYGIPGYTELPRTEKNNVYDLVIKELDRRLK